MKSEHIGFWSSLLLHSFTALAFFTLSSNISQSSETTNSDNKNASQLMLAAHLVSPSAMKTELSEVKTLVSERQIQPPSNTNTVTQNLVSAQKKQKFSPIISPTIEKSDSRSLADSTSSRPVKNHLPQRNKFTTKSKTFERKSTSIQEQQASAVQPAIATPSVTTTSEHSGLPADYETTVRLTIMRHKFYPSRARRKKQTGTAIVRFRVHADGSYDQLAIQSSSGHKLLDQAAMDAVRKVNGFSPFPEPTNLIDQTYRIPIVFR